MLIIKNVHIHWLCSHSFKLLFVLQMSDICVFGLFFFFQEFAGEDMSDLFLEEREMAIRQAQDEKRKLQMAVPGILGPHEIPEEMQD